MLLENWLLYFCYCLVCGFIDNFSFLLLHPCFFSPNIIYVKGRINNKTTNLLTK